jgi:hypothetical protein
MKMSGLDLNLEEEELEDIRCGLDILTCHLMEEGKVPSSMAGSQDVLLPTLIGGQVNQTMLMTMKIMQQFILTMGMEAYGKTGLLKINFTAAVSTP